MDETTQSRVSDAAATRKRRSSILKSQRPARTPFSELEFHVTTPTDTTKSRRVSFSRRTGVAEFATNEATTTWKNFYEEHNKSLESSGNDTSANASKQQLGHIGKRIFDQQFEEVDVADFMGSLNPGYNINSSISNINIAQLTSIERTEDIKFKTSQSNFELSAFTKNHSKLFSDDITVHGMGEQSGLIDINFSAVQNIGEKDDLDEIQKDIQNQGNVICHGPFRDRQNLSEYIEIDLNSTHAVLRESDMSITDTIHSPKVQEVSKSVSIEKIVNKDWKTDKENIAVNPYVTPKESLNFAINEEPDKVLVFDGKRLTIQGETVSSKPSRQTITPSQIEPPKIAQRKTIVLNVNDDLPNFINDPINASGYVNIADLKKHTEFDNSMSITNPIVNIDQTQMQKTMVYDDDIGDISLTQAVSSNIVQDKRRTTVFEDNISITQAVPTNILDKSEKRRTILCENDTGNISITQALPTNVVFNERRKTVVYENEDCNISMTQALPANILAENVPNKRKTIVYEDGACNLSITQAVPNIMISVKSPEKSPCVSENELGNMSVTQAIPSNIIIEGNLNERRRTVVFESDTGNISVTQAVPANLIFTSDPNSHISVDDSKPYVISNLKQENQRKTIVFENDDADISMTQVVSINKLLSFTNKEKTEVFADTKKADTIVNQRKTIVFENEDADISMTQVVPMNKPISFTNNEKSEVFDDTKKADTIVNNNEEADMSVTQAIDQIISGFENTISKDIPKSESTEKRRTIVFDDENADISMTQVVDVKQSVPEALSLIKDAASDTNVVKNIVYDEANISMTELIPTSQEHEKYIKPGTPLGNEDSKPNVAPKKSNINEILDFSMDEDVKMAINKTDYERVAKEMDISADNSSVAKPIPYILSQIQQDAGVLEKSMKQCYKTAESELLNHTPNVSKILVYQMSQSDKIVQQDIEKQDPELQPPMAVLSDEEKEPDNPKLDDETESEVGVETVPSSSKVNEDVINLTIDDTSDSPVDKIEPDTSAKMIIEQSESCSMSPVHIVLMTDSPSKSEVKEKEATLNDLLDMSSVCSLEEKPTHHMKMVSFIDRKDSQVSEKKTEESEGSWKKKSSDNMFYITNKSSVDQKDSLESEIKAKESEERSKDTSRDKMFNITNELSVVQKDSIVSEGMAKESKVSLKETSKDKMSYITNESFVHQKDSVEFEEKAQESEENLEDSSRDKMFYITNDDNEEVSTKVPQIEQIAPLPLEFKEETHISGLQKKINLLKKVFHGKKGKHRQSTTDEETLLDANESNISKNVTKYNKSFKYANDTNELLDMLSDLTDRPMSRTLDPHLEIDEEKPESLVEPVPEPVIIKGHLALENKSELATAQRRISFAPLSREDLLNNISMAGAALQKTRLELDETESMNETTNESPDLDISDKKPSRLSKEVVKTLQFDEDSITEISEANNQAIPLKKTAFGETSYMPDNKSKVIPNYLDDVADGLKELMFDLVKPMSDNTPFNSSSPPERMHGMGASTCSMEVQANLITSSQVDINLELYSNSDSTNDLPETSSVEIIKDAVRRSIKQSLKSPIKSVSNLTPPSDESMNVMVAPRTATSAGRVIVFDHHNPLNNILLPPLQSGNVHKYNPDKTEFMTCVTEETYDSAHRSPNQVLSTQMHVENIINYPKDLKTESTMSYVSKELSMDRSENTRSDLKDREVNTVIAMKVNRELLEASSSLTLVDDTMNCMSDAAEKKPSAVQLLYKVDEDEPENCDLTSSEDLRNHTKAKKRIYSPAKVDKHDKHKHCTIVSLITPKPLSKIQKISEKFFKQDKTEKPVKLIADKMETNIIKKHSPTKPAKRSSPTRQHKRKDHSTKVTIQQVMMEVKMNDTEQKLKQEVTDPKSLDISSAEPKSGSISNSGSIDMVSSFTSSKNLMRDDRSTVTSSGEYGLTDRIESDDCSGMDWRDADENIRNLAMDCDSSANIVAKIDKLPFMGSHDCEWESSIGDTWTFRLLHSCLRLTVRLQHRHENAARCCVRADTPVLHSQIDIIHTEKKNPIAALCIRFAGEAMRFEVGLGCGSAAAVPALLRRCACAARRAARWAAALHDARARLACSLTHDGLLALKVANIALRSVWEVRFKIEVVVSEAGGAPYPRATPLGAARVLAERRPRTDELRRLARDIPHDWGHAPRTVWRIFKYLKHKKRDDEFLELNY